jgi:hypothetical protein
VFLVFTGRAWAGGPYMMIGAAENIAVQPDLAIAQADMAKARLAGLTTIRLAQTWTRGETKLAADDKLRLGNAISAATFDDIRVILSIYPYGSSQTPLTPADQDDFASYAADIAKQFPTVRDFIVGNEPNLNRFWLPQFGPDGEDVAAPAYESLLAETYDALKAVRPHSTIYGGALAPRGIDRPGSGRDTHSPTAFITDLGAAYKASGRQIPIMDAFAFHPYPENSSLGPDFPHPNSTAIGLADYDKLVGLLGQAFDGTAQRGSQLPILYDEFGIESQIPPAKASLYTGKEPATTKPVDEATQARMYQQAMAMAFCQKTVLGLLLFHVQDETALSAWQSGVYYADGSAKTSFGAVRGAAFAVHHGVIAQCPGLHLTPKVTLTGGTSATGQAKLTVGCDLDCAFTVRLDRRPPVSGRMPGGATRVLRFFGKLALGPHSASVTATATLNPGPPGKAALTFRAG